MTVLPERPVQGCDRLALKRCSLGCRLSPCSVVVLRLVVGPVLGNEPLYLGDGFTLPIPRVRCGQRVTGLLRFGELVPRVLDVLFEAPDTRELLLGHGRVRHSLNLELFVAHACTLAPRRDASHWAALVIPAPVSRTIDWYRQRLDTQT